MNKTASLILDRIVQIGFVIFYLPNNSYDIDKNRIPETVIIIIMFFLGFANRFQLQVLSFCFGANQKCNTISPKNMNIQNIHTNDHEMMAITNGTLDYF